MMGWIFATVLVQFLLVTMLFGLNEQTRRVARGEIKRLKREHRDEVECRESENENQNETFVCYMPDVRPQGRIAIVAESPQEAVKTFAHDFAKEKSGSVIVTNAAGAHIGKFDFIKQGNDATEAQVTA